MKTLLVSLGLLGFLLLPPAQTQAPGPRSTGPQRLDVLRMTAVQDGHFLVNLQQGGHERLVNFDVSAGKARSVTGSDPQLLGLTGEFQLIGNGVFLISFANRHHRASQFWVFRENGHATVKEIPDRGERQEAVPVEDNSLERPGATD